MNSHLNQFFIFLKTINIFLTFFGYPAYPFSFAFFFFYLLFCMFVDYRIFENTSISNHR